MADGNQRQVELTQETLDKGHKRLDGLIDLTDRARVQACLEGETDLRDVLDEMGAHLKMARSCAGKIKLANGVAPRSGSK